MAASRVGLWSFDLIQVKQLQETLVDHPRRNNMYVVQLNYVVSRVLITISQGCPPTFDAKCRRINQVRYNCTLISCMIDDHVILQVHCSNGPLQAFSIPLGRTCVLHLRLARRYHLHVLPLAR